MTSCSWPLGARQAREAALVSVSCKMHPILLLHRTSRWQGAIYIFACQDDLVRILNLKDNLAPYDALMHRRPPPSAKAAHLEATERYGFHDVSVQVSEGSAVQVAESTAQRSLLLMLNYGPPRSCSPSYLLP